MPRSSWFFCAALVAGLTLVATACDDSGSGADPDVDADTTGDTQDTDVPIGGGAGLVINEVVAAGDPLDWVELYNGSSDAIDLSTLSLTDDLDDDGKAARFEATAGVLQPGGYAVVFLTRDGWPGFQLGAAESIWLLDASGTPIDSATWREGQSPAGASWGRIPNGSGDFKTLLTPTQGAANIDNDSGANCGDGVIGGAETCDDGNTRAGDGCSSTCTVEEGYDCGSAEPSVCAAICGDGLRVQPEQCDTAIVPQTLPCTAECRLTITPGTSGVRINEVVHRDANPEAADWIELINTGDSEVDLGGWRLADEDFTENFTPLPPGLTIAPGQRLVFERDNMIDPTLGFGFGLDSNDAVLLIDASGALVDIADWLEGQVPDGASFARSPDGTGAFTAQSPPTRGTANR